MSKVSGLSNRFKSLKKNANFQYDQHHVRDGVILHVFTRHEAFDKQGKALPSDGRYQPGNTKTANKEVKQDEDPAEFFSSDEEEEIIDIHDDTVEEKKVHTHKFTINFVARYPDDEDDLILHWGMSRK